MHGHSRARAITQFFWLVVLTVIVLFAFFVALGGFGLSEVGWMAVLVGVLVVLWVVHAVWVGRHAGPGPPDRMAAHERERRGF